jgi:Bacterial regulatory proteins, luxR family
MSRSGSDSRPTPDGITPLVGYRYWTLSVLGERWTLRSMNGELVHEVTVDQAVEQRDDAWLVAHCLVDAHAAPEESCACGFYAVKSFSALKSSPGLLWRAASRATAHPKAITHRVAGRVHLAGKIVEHDLGYRAERMRIAELRPFRGTEQIVARFAQCLAVPVGEPFDPTDPSGAPLTGRETEPLRQLAEGRPLVEIVDTLQLSDATVRSMTSYILQKLRQHDPTA